MKSLLLLLQCSLFVIGYSLADNAGQCQITGIDDSDYLTVYTIYINDTQIDTNVLETPYSGTLEVQNFESSVTNSYFEVTTEDNNFVIKTNPEFANFDENTNKQESNLYLINLECSFQCSAGTSSLTIRVFVTDINTHSPQFNLEKYEYKVASPIMPRTDFSIYGDVAIITTDIDFSNQNVVFTIEPDDFGVTALTSSTSKVYTAVFAAKSVVQLTGNRTYTITATDSGTNPGPLTSNTTVTLILDESTSLDIPTFESSSYSFNYSVDGSTPKLTDLDGPITLTTNKGTSLTDITITGNYNNYFNAAFDPTSSTFDLSVTDLLPMSSVSFIILTLTVSTDNTAVTSLVVYLPEENGETTVEFSMHYYTASYNDIRNDVTLDNAIEVISTTTPNVSLTGEYAEHFDINYDNKTKSYQVTVKSNLTITEIKSKSYITVTLKASVGDYYDTAILVLSLPEHILQFTQALYTATYNSDKTISLDDSTSIGFTTDTKGVKILIAGTYQDYIDTEYNSKENQWLLVVKKPLSNEILQTEKDLVITLEATDDYNDQAQSVIYIKLPNEIADVPTFSKSYYLADYIVNDDIPSISINEDIFITNRDNQSNIIITLDSYNDYFVITYNKTVNRWNFKVLSSLTDDILLAKKELIIVLTAEEENNTNKGKSIVVVNWITKERLKFSQAYYVGTYPENGTGIIEIQPTINFDNVDDINDVIIGLDSYTENFDLSYKSNKWTLTINKKLDDSILTSYGELVITLTATEDNKNEGKSVLIIELPTVKEAPKFSSSYYIAEYPESGRGTIQFDSDISFTNIKDPENITITLDNYNDYFEIKYAINMWYINIRKSFEDAVLFKNTELTMTMIATVPGINDKGESALVIKLPTASNGSAPHFKDAYYIAEYPEDMSSVIEFENPIGFTNVVDPTKITISLDNYAGSFEIIYKEDKGIWVINIKKSLDNNIVLKNVELVMSLIATETGNKEKGQSALVLKLPSAANITAPKFSAPYYIAEYSASGSDTIEFENPIEITNVDDPTQLTISLDQYADNFEFSYKFNRWYIKIKKSLDKSVLYRNAELVMSLIATEEGNKNEGASALVLNLPTATNGTAPKFTEAYYIAEYPESGSGIIGFDNPITFTNVDDPQTLILSLDQFADNFQITYESNKFQLHIIKSLEQTVLHGNVELVMTLIASEVTYEEKGLSALILKLPTATNGTAPKFLDAYYIAEYPENGTGIIEFENPIQFTNVDELTEISIQLDKYKTNFEIAYHSNRWYMNINKGLDESVLHTNVELVMTLIATTSDSNKVGESALVLKLPTAEIGMAPRFTEAYYLAKYPKNGTGIIEFEKPVAFTNVDNITNIGIIIDNYSENLEILHELNRWYIKIIKSLDEAVVHKNTELAFTLTATEIGNKEKGRSALVLELPTNENETVIEFSEAYYIARYPINGSGTIELETPLKFKNVDDPQSVEISLSKYSSNFEILYDGKKWYINIISSLDESVLIENTELVITLSAHKKSDDEAKGYSVLILSLQSPSEAPKFSKTYYMAEYPANGAGIIEFKSPVNFSNVDSSDVQITLDNYVDNFKIVFSEDRWYINILQSLKESILNKNVEIVMTMIATETGHEVEGDAALVLILPKAAVAPEFADAYYLAEYPENGTGKIEFETPISFLNVEDPTTISISLDRYSSNFDIKHSSKVWYINIKKKLDDSVINGNTELIITLTATEMDIKNQGRAILVLKLPSATKVPAPEFAEAYYIANYPKSGNGTIEFENPIAFSNVNDPKILSITLDNYTDKFEVTYASDTWNIKIKNYLDDDILTRNVELVMTMIATETKNENVGYAALVLKLPTAVNGTAIKFSEAYYTAEYPRSGKGTAVDIKSPIQFLNVDDIKLVTISLETYQDIFKISYASKKWMLNVNQNLDEDTLRDNTEIVLTLVATNNDDNTETRAVLVLKLPTETSPIFSEAYYTAKYPEDVKDVIEFENAISFKNIDDSSKITIKLDKYTDYFDIILLSNKWMIQVKKILEDSILIGNTELVTTLIATEDGKENKGYSALVLKLPTTNANKAPEFSKAFYTASYKIDADKSSVILSDAINVTNKEDLNKIKISVDNYQENFSVIYNNGTNSWSVNVLIPISESILISKTDLIISLTATDTVNNLKGYSVIDLTLPPSDSKTAPLFSSTYYTGTYAFSDDTPLVTLDAPINITNKGDLTDISITIENYADNFKIQYVAESNEWKMDVVKNLDESVLNSKMDLIMTLTAIDASSNEVGRCALLLTLPVVNNDEAPKFSSIYYLGQYDRSKISLNNSINIINKNDLTNVKINVNDRYKGNFEINYDTGLSKWLLNVKSPLNESIVKNNMELVLTLTATETDNTNIGQAALVLELPLEDSSLPPRFSHAHYTGKYVFDDDNQATVILNDTITIVNKENIVNISVTLDSFETNFKIDYDSTNKRWTLNVIHLISEDDLKSDSELILTLIATEAGNNNIGESTLILALPSSHDNSTEEVVKFSQVHYVASYDIEGENGIVEMSDIIKVEGKGDLTNLVVTIENEEYADYFQINPDSDTYVVTVQTPLPSTILSTRVSLPLTLIAAIDDNKAYATLVINLPAAVTDQAIQFSQPLYEGTYQKTSDGTVNFQVTGSIEVQTEADDDDIEKRITSTTGYEEYFGLSYSSKVLTVIKTQDLPESTLRSNSFIPLILTVGISGTTEASSAVLNVVIDFSDEENANSIAFSSVLYSGKYEVTNGTEVLTINDQITIITDEPDTNVDVSVTNEYDHYFTASYSNKVVTVESLQPLTTDILNTTTFVPVTLQASVVGTSHQEYAVLNIILIYNSKEDPGLIQFSTVLYTGEYSTHDGKGHLALNEDITVITDAADEQIEPSISDGSEYATYFDVTYASNTVIVKLKEDVPEDLLTDTTLIALTLTVGIKGTTHRSSSVLNIIINVTDNGEIRSIRFSDVLYNGRYEVDNGNGILIINDDIMVITNETDSNIAVTVSNEYDSYFTTNYSNKIVTISLEKQLSSEILKSSFIPIVLHASISGTSYEASAVLNIILYYDGANDTGLIEFSSVLYTAEYSAYDGKGKLNLGEDIKVITDRTDKEIDAHISEDSEYNEYFTISYSDNIVSIKLKETLPEDVTKNSFIALTLIASITGTIHRSTAVLNIDFYNDNNNDSKNCEVPEMQTVYISVISILSILLIAIIAAVLAFYFLRIRKRNYTNLEEEDGKIRYKKSLQRSSSDIKPATTLDERRPTGFIFNPIREDSIDGTDSIGEPEKSRRKSVAFDDNVEKLQIEDCNEEDNVSEDDNKNNNPEITHV